ncbi:MAG TPA: O-antigen ligase family protein [Gaiellaceae bacterium]|jgi:O-antigen ligase
MSRARELAAPAAIAASVIAAAFASAIQRDLFNVGRPLRWVILIVLAAVALTEALAHRRSWQLRPRVVAPVAFFLALCLVSAGWSTSVHSTLGRAGGEIVVVVAVAALAGTVAARPARAERFLAGAVVGVAVIAVGSLVYLVTHPSGFYGAWQAATTAYPRRFRGLEFNPNTLAMLLALAMPPALAWAVDRRRRRAQRLSLVALLALCAVEESLSGSRGGILAAATGCLVVAALLPIALPRRGLVMVAVLAGVIVVAGTSTIPKALPASAASPSTPAPKTRGINAERVLPLEAEIGNPWWTHKSGAIHRSLFETSERLRALKGSVQRGLERPLLGWGYGAETDAFVNRYYGFDSQNPENGYVGIFLQLGLIGLLAFLAAVGSCLAAGIAGARRAPGYTPAAIVGVAAAALVLGLSQSYFHGPGGVAFVAAWLSLLLASVLGLSPAQAQPNG